MRFDFDFDRFCQVLARETPDAVIYADGEGTVRFWNLHRSALGAAP